MKSSAVMDGPYRYRLQRIWLEKAPRLAIIMLNPSKADGRENDPTIKKCMWFAGAWHYGGIDVVNFCAYRATDPDDLLLAARMGTDIYGPKNYQHVRDALTNRDVLVACGQRVAHLDYTHVQTVRIIIDDCAKRTLCLAVSQWGWPKHPLYVRKDAQPQDFTWRI